MHAGSVILYMGSWFRNSWNSILSKIYVFFKSFIQPNQILSIQFGFAMFLISWPKMSYYRNSPQYSRSFFSVTLLRYFNVCKVLSVLKDAAAFDQATILTLAHPQCVKILTPDFSEGNGKGTTRSKWWKEKVDIKPAFSDQTLQDYGWGWSDWPECWQVPHLFKEMFVAHLCTYCLDCCIQQA